MDDLDGRGLASQALQIVKTTSRASNPWWYRPASAFQTQLHIWYDGGATPPVTAIFDRRAGSWEPGPPIPPDTLATGSGIEPVLDSLRVRRTTGLGVLFHSASDVAVIKANRVEPGEEMAARAAVVSDPGPFFAAAPVAGEVRLVWLDGADAAGLADNAVLVSCGAGRGPFLAAVSRWGNSRNIPVAVALLSAPLEMCAAALRFLPPGSENAPRVAVAVYKMATLLAVYSGSGALMSLRAIPHRAASHPHDLGEAVMASARACNISDGVLVVVQCSSEADMGVVGEDLAAHLGSAETGSPIAEATLVAVSDYTPENAPGGRPEFILHDADRSGSVDTLRAVSEGWLLQDYHTHAESADFPSMLECRLAAAGAVVRNLLTLAAAILAAAGIWHVGVTVSSQEWRLGKTEAQESRKRLAALVDERNAYEFTAGLVAPRSPAWLLIEMVCRLFPEGSGVVLSQLRYDFRNVPDPAKADSKVGFERRLTLRGYADQTGLALLNSVETPDGLGAKLAEIAAVVPASSALERMPSRQLEVALSRSANPEFGRPGPQAAYQNSFEMTIIERGSPADPLAIMPAKPPPHQIKPEARRISLPLPFEVPYFDP